MAVSEIDSPAEKIRRRIDEYKRELHVIERREESGKLDHAEAESIRKAIRNSIAVLRKIPVSLSD